MRFWKYCLALMLCLGMSLGLMSVSASAEDGCVRIGNQTYERLTAAVQDANNGDTLWLTGNDTTEQQVTIDKSLTIELQGHALSSTALKVTGSTTSVTINDRVGTGSINGNHSAGFGTDHNRCTATVVVADGATLTINGVTGMSKDSGTVIHDCANNDLEKALFVQEGSTLVINGGTFVATSGAGYSSLFVYDGTVTINDGYFYANISYNTAPSIDKPLTIKKCEIYNPNESGAVWIQNSGSINGVSFGSGFQSLESIQKVFLASSTGSKVLDGSTKNHVKIGCGIYASDAVRSTTLADGTIYAVGSADEGSPETITPTEGGKITLAPQIAGGDGTAISYTWTKDGSTLSGANGSTYTIDSYSSTDDGSYTVTATEGGTSVSLYYRIGSSSDDSGAHSHCVCGGGVSTGGHVHDETTPTWTEWDGTSDITYTGKVAYVYLTDSAERSSGLTVTDGNTLNLCLNGKKLSRNATVITVKGNATLNICDCVGDGEITVTSGSTINVETENTSNVHTTLNLYGGKISTDSTFDSGTIKLYNNDGNNSQTVAVFNMYGGAVNNGYYSGYAVYASYANIGTGYYNINIYGGNVTCEKGYGIGGSFNGSKNITMQITGGTIKSGYDGIQLFSGNTLTLSGNPQFIDGNHSYSYAGINIPNDVTLTVASDFAPADDTKISVKKNVDSSDSVVIAQPAEGNENLAEKAQYFVSSKEGYFVECGKGDGNLQLSTCAITEQPTKENDYTVTANGSDSGKVEYQWYPATAGTVKVTDKNATAGDYSCYYGDEYRDRWCTRIDAESAEAVTWNAFTLHMTKGDVLTVKYEDMSRIGSESNSRGYFNDFTLTGQWCDSITGSEGYYTTKAFTAPADGDYTLTVEETPRSSSSGSYFLSCDFSATVTADVAGNALRGQTSATLDTEELEVGKYLCAVTWEDKTTLYSKAVEAGTSHSHCVCGESDCGKTEEPHGEAHTWTAWNGGEISYDNNTAYVYLKQDINLSSHEALTIAAGKTLYLCLNGKTLTGAEGCSVILNNGTLILTDCKKTGKITHKTGENGHGIQNRNTLTIWNGSITGNHTGTGGSGGGVYNGSGSTFAMYGGSITGNSAGINGGGVYNYGSDNGNGNGSTFDMYGGTIAGNSAYEGGGVYNGPNGSFTMTGGVIGGDTAEEGNKAEYDADDDYGGNGGGVSNDGGVFIMKGDAKISYNTASLGGGVYHNDSNNGSTNSKFALSENAEISNNKANTGKFSGGGVYSFGDFEMSGGSITGNEANHGGGVYNTGSNYAFTMSGGSITGNEAEFYGGGVFNFGTLNMSDSAEIAGNQAYYGGGVYNYGTLNMSGTPQVSGNKKGGTITDGKLSGGTDNNVYVCSGSYSVTVRNPLGEGASVGITGTKGHTAVSGTTVQTGFFCDDSATYHLEASQIYNNCLTLAEHNFDTWQSDENGHWKKCSGCEAKKDTAIHSYDKEVVAAGYLKSNATCTNKAVYYKSCVCGKKGTETFESGEVDADNHDFVNGTWQSDENGHWKKCSRCEAIDEGTKADHSYDDNKDAVCDTCGYTRTIRKSSGSSGSSSASVGGNAGKVSVSVDLNGTTAEVAEIGKSSLEKIGTEKTVLIDVSSLDKSVTGVKLSTDTLANISASEADGVEIKLPHAEVQLDQQTLTTVTKQATGSDIRLVVEPDKTARSSLNTAQKKSLADMKNAVTLEAYFVSNGVRISDFGGGTVELTIPYQAEGEVHAWYLREDGVCEPVTVHYDKQNARLTLFHFSHYIIAEGEIEETKETEEAEDEKACPKDETCPLAAFHDVKMNEWYHDGAHFCVECGLMKGVSAGVFAPSSNVTRAQLAAILWRLEGSPATTGGESFLDVAEGAWYTEAIRWAKSEGVVSGYDDEHFGPNDAITREQMVALLYRYAQHKGLDVSIGEDALHFDDAQRISAYAVPAMQWAVGSGIVSGMEQDGSKLLVPKVATTRAQMASLMMRFCETL